MATSKLMFTTQAFAVGLGIGICTGLVGKTIGCATLRLIRKLTSGGKKEKIQLVYWDIRGLAEPARALLEYAGGDYEDVRLDAGLPNSKKYKKDWVDQKFTLGLDFPNLPYLIHGQVKISQSVAIMRYLGRYFNLMPPTEEQMQRMDLTMAQIVDVRSGLTSCCYGADEAAGAAFVQQKLIPQLVELSQFLGTHLFFAATTKPTPADFMVLEVLELAIAYSPDCIDATTSPLHAFIARMLSLPTMAAYRASPRFKARPFNNPHALFK